MKMKTRRLWLKSNQYSNHYYNNHSVKVQTNNQFEVIKVENRKMIKISKKHLKHLKNENQEKK